MVVLKRVKASTLMETLVATVLIVIIFMISSMILNNLLANNVKQNVEIAQEKLNQLEYQFKNGAIELPYYENVEPWEFSVSKENMNGVSIVTLEAENPKTKKILTNYISDEN